MPTRQNKYMNIWKVETDVDRYMWVLLSETEKISCLHLDKLLNRKGNRVTLDESIIFHFQPDNQKQIGDIMYTAPSYWLVNEKVKKMVEKEYGEIFQFIPAYCENIPFIKYYIMLSLVFVEAIDMKKSEYNCHPYSNIYGNILRNISHYVFNDNAKRFPFFKIRQGDYYHYNWHFANDDFKNFIEKKQITGLKFEKIFEFKD